METGRLHQSVCWRARTRQSECGRVRVLLEVEPSLRELAQAPRLWRRSGLGGRGLPRGVHPAPPRRPVCKPVLRVGGGAPYSATAIFFLKVLMEVSTLSFGLNVYRTVL